MGVPRETVAFVMGAITGHALATARKAQAEVKLARVREALRWTRAAVPSYETNVHTRASEAYKETAP
jgi:hypothetical protein